MRYLSIKKSNNIHISTAGDLAMPHKFLLSKQNKKPYAQNGRTAPPLDA
jgi:hypothetical protein